MPRERAHPGEVERLLPQAFREADALGYRWVGPENFLLAILASSDRPLALVALNDCGIEHDAFAEAFKQSIDGSDPPVDYSEEYDSTSMNPAAYALRGRAEGVAAGLGAPAVTREHVLIAYLWDTSSGELEMLCGVTREAVMTRLRDLGVEVPRGELPPSPVRRPQTRVFIPYPDHMRVVEALVERLPRDSGFGFNHDGSSRAWVVADTEIDLEARVAAILVELGVHPEVSAGEAGTEP